MRNGFLTAIVGIALIGGALTAAGADAKELAAKGYSALQSALAGDEARLPEAIQYMEQARQADATNVDNLYNLARAYFFEAIPPMILQPLVENAIKHGISPKIEGGEVRIAGRSERDGLVLIVEDSGAGQRPGRQRGTGIGLKNVRERLQHIYGDSATLKLEDLRPAGTRAILFLPEPVGVHP